MSNLILEVALQLAEKGLLVFFVSSSKIPCADTHDFKDATTDLEKLNTIYRPGSLLALRTGAASGGLMVLDVDPLNGGDESLAKLEKNMERYSRAYSEHVCFRFNPSA